jgi:NitT/TauT family transport system permease protein
MHHSSASNKNKLFLSLGSFLIPLLIWSCVSYLPFIWHPQVQITNSGDASYLQVGTRLAKDAYYAEAQISLIKEKSSYRHLSQSDLFTCTT